MNVSPVEVIRNVPVIAEVTGGFTFKRKWTLYKRRALCEDQLKTSHVS